MDKCITIEALNKTETVSFSIEFIVEDNPKEEEQIKQELYNAIEDITFDNYTYNDILYGKFTCIIISQYILSEQRGSKVSMRISRQYYVSDPHSFAVYIMSQIYKKNKLGNIFFYTEVVSFKHIEYINKDIIIKVIETLLSDEFYLKLVLVSLFRHSPIEYITNLVKENQEIFSRIDDINSVYMNHQLFRRDKTAFFNLFRNDLIFINEDITVIPKIYLLPSMLGDKTFVFIMKMSYLKTQSKIDYKDRFLSTIKLI